MKEAVEQKGASGKVRAAIQGELGSNSHMAAMEAFGESVTVVPCAVSAEVFERLLRGEVEAAVLPIENSLHGSVTEHYDLIREGIWITGEVNLRIRHNVMAAPGVRLEEIRRVSSHPVALSQCRRWLRAHPEIAVMPGYDTAGSVKDVMAQGLRDAAGIAPALAAEVYGAEVLVEGIEDHAENWTRFYVLVRRAGRGAGAEAEDANKMSLAFTLEHRPGSLLRALAVFGDAGVDLLKIESRPVMGKPWEYVFFVDFRFGDRGRVETALGSLREVCEEMEVLGVYRAAGA